MKKRIQVLEREIGRVKRELMGLGDLRPGSLSEQYNVCGKPGCRCKGSPAKKHGPYYQLSYTRGGRSGTKFIRRENIAQVRRQVDNYVRMRKLMDRWVELATKLSELRLEKPKSK